VPAWVLIAIAAALGAYVLFVAMLVVLGRREQARALAGFIPDCIVLFRRLLGDERVARRHRFLLWALIGYLALPIDLVPDVIPVAGQLDDAVIVALVLRALLRGGGPALVREHWPGPPASLAVILRLMGGGTGAVAPAPHAESGGDDRP
jgi:uncharacterized membrane protein YkvA (DUF1232 family)